MLVVVRVDLRMAFEAHRDRVVDRIAATLFSRDDVVCLHLDAAKAVTDATSAVDSRQEFGDLLSPEGHAALVLDLLPNVWASAAAASSSRGLPSAASRCSAATIGTTSSHFDEQGPAGQQRQPERLRSVYR
jgi:hypothetical protein